MVRRLVLAALLIAQVVMMGAAPTYWSRGYGGKGGYVGVKGQNGTPRLMPLASYTNTDYDHTRWATGYSSADYDSMATNDIQVIGSELFRPFAFPNHLDVCAEVKSRNPNTIVLAYLSVYGLRKNHETSLMNDPFRRFWDLAESMGAWAPMLDGSYEQSWNEEYRVLNFGSSVNPAFPDSMARLVIDAFALTSNGQNGMGLFLDWFEEGAWPAWAVNIDSLDLDRDGIAHALDQDEQDAYVTGNSRFLQRLRVEAEEQLGREIVIFLNGGAVEYEPEYYPYVDGTMWENMQEMSLSSPAKWEYAAACADSFYKGNFIKAINFADARGDSVFYRTEAIGLLLEAVGTCYPPDVRGDTSRFFSSLKSYRTERLDLGRPIHDLVYVDDTSPADQDTVRRAFERGHVTITFTGIDWTRWNSLEYTIRDASGGILSTNVNESPAAPFGLSSFSDDAVVELFWDESPEPDVDHHLVYRGTTSGSLSLLHTFATTERDYTDTAVVNGTTYFYAVSVVDASGNESDLSYETSETPNPAALAFTEFTVNSASEAP